MSDETQQPEYLSTFCPILSHAVLRPADLKQETKQMLIPLGGELKSTEAATPPEAEYIGCQGPSCAFFLRSEGKCCIPLMTQAVGVMIGVQLGQIKPPAAS